MEYAEFLDKLAETKGQWYIRVGDGGIRQLPKFRNNEDTFGVKCPAQIVLGRQADIYAEWERNVVCAADNGFEHDSAIREALINTCGVDETVRLSFEEAEAMS